MGQIYGIKRKGINKIVYVGQTIRNYKIRWQQHKQQAKERHYALYNALNKYGIDNFYPILIEECENEKLNEREQYWIKQCHTKIEEDGYNLTDGGDTPSRYMCKPVYQYTLEGEYIQSFPSIIEVQYQLGISTGNISRALKSESKESHGFLWSDTKYTTLPKDCHKSCYRTKISQYDKDGKYIQTFTSLREAALSCGKPTGSSNIQAAAKGKRLTAYGYKWKFVD